MRLFAATIATETNTFPPIPTGLASFHAAYVYRPGEHPAEPQLCTAPLFVARRRAKAEGFTLVEGSCFWAEPSGSVVRRDYEAMRDEILAQVKAATPLDGVLLGQWTYRSFRNEPKPGTPVADLLFGEGVMTITSARDGVVTGSFDFGPGYQMAFKGAITYGNPVTLQFQV